MFGLFAFAGQSLGWAPPLVFIILNQSSDGNLQLALITPVAFYLVGLFIVACLVDIAGAKQIVAHTLVRRTGPAFQRQRQLQLQEQEQQRQEQQGNVPDEARWAELTAAAAAEGKEHGAMVRVDLEMEMAMLAAGGAAAAANSADSDPPTSVRAATPV